MNGCHTCTCFLSPPCTACTLCSHVDLSDDDRNDCDYTCATCPYPCDEHPEVVLAGMTPETHPQGDATPMVECPDCHGDTGPSMMTHGSGLTFDQCGKCDGIGKIPDFGTYRNPAAELLWEVAKTIQQGIDSGRSCTSIAATLMQYMNIPERKPNPPVVPHFYIHSGGRISSSAVVGESLGTLVPNTPIDSTGFDAHVINNRTVRNGDGFLASGGWSSPADQTWPMPSSILGGIRYPPYDSNPY